MWLGSHLGALVALALFALFYLSFFAKSLLNGDYIAPSDSLDFWLAAFLSEQSVWTDYMYSGYPIAADPQSLTWYPVFQFFAVFGQGWNLFLILPYVIASWTCFLFVRRLSGSFVAGLFAGIVYGFSGTLLAHVSHVNQIHVAAWLPLLPYSVLLVRSGEDLKGILIGSLALFMMVVAGHPQIMVYAVYLTGAYVLYAATLAPASNRKPLHIVLVAGASIALGFGLSAIQLLPAQELASLGKRAEALWVLFIDKALPPSQLLTLVFPLSFGGFRTHTNAVPYFGESSPGEMTGYVGLLPFILAFLGIWYVRRHRQEALFWGGASVVGILLALGDATPLAQVSYHLPLYSAFRVPARHLFLVAFCVAVTAGLVLSAVMTEWPGRFIPRRLAAYAVAVAVGVLAWYFYDTPHALGLLEANGFYLRWAYLLPVVITVAIATAVTCFGGRAKATRLLVTVLFLIHIVDMLTFHYVLPGYRFEYAETSEERVSPPPDTVALREMLRLENGARIIGADGNKNPFLPLNLSRAWRMPSAGGSGPMGVARYVDMLGMGGPGDLNRDVFSRQHHGLDLVSVRFVLIPRQSPIASADQLDPGRWTLVDTLAIDPESSDNRRHYWLVRNERALPRAWLVPNVTVVGKDDMLETIWTGKLPNGGSFEPRHVALIEENLTGFAEGERPALGSECGSVSIARISSSVREYLIDTEVPCFLVMSEVFYPWWRASINGHDADLLQTNYALMGLFAPSGKSNVRIALAPNSLYLGILLTVLSVLMWLALFKRAMRSTAG